MLWSLLRTASIAGANALPLPPGEAISPLGPYSLSVLVAALSIGLLIFELHRRGELLFLANLGRSTPALATFAAAWCVLFESLLRIAYG